MPHKSNFLFWLQWANLAGPSPKKVETMEAPQNRRFYEKMECLPLWPTYIGEKRRTLGRTYGIKARCYWEHPWGTHWEPRECIGNLMGIHWELERNILGTKGKMKKILPLPPFSPTQNLKGKKKSRHFEFMLSLPIGWMKFLFPKPLVTIFGLG